jgi:serine/threonine protein kinase
MVMSPCPPIERLGALIRGELDEAEGVVIEDHLERCDSCRIRLHALSDWALSGAFALTIAPEAIGLRAQNLLNRLERLSSAPVAAAVSSRYRRESAGDAYDGLPAELPGFRGIREVGRGGMGTIYRAEQRGLDRAVALKVLSEGRGASPGLRERFQREVMALARLRHPNVVQIHGVDEHDGLDFLVMEWVEGGDLARRLSGGPLPVREAVEIALPLARAIQAAHDQGIVHRDLKPGNVLLSVEGGAPGRPTPKVGDFGLAKLVEDDSALTLSGVFVGTPSYMAPEQTGLVDSSAHGLAIDIYGLGTILY